MEIALCNYPRKELVEDELKCGLPTPNEGSKEMRKTTIIHGLIVLPALLAVSTAVSWSANHVLDLGDTLSWLLITALTTLPAYLACRWHATVRTARSEGYADGYLQGVADRIQPNCSPR